MNTFVRALRSSAGLKFIVFCFVLVLLNVMSGSHIFKNFSFGNVADARTSLPKRKPTPTPTPTITLTPTPTVAAPTPTPIPSSTNYHWDIRSVSSMKETKDKVCGPRSASFVDQWMATAKELGVNYVSIETPYDSPSCGDSLAYTKLWVGTARKYGLKVWHRHMPVAFEGIYSVPKNNQTDYIGQIASYIKNNPDLFAAGDIFTPIPEPQNGGIWGVTYCPQGICQFTGPQSFNAWLRNAMVSSQSAFDSIGLSGSIKVGYYGFDGFVAWGDNNPDWTGILEDATVSMMGNITIDHYPETVGDTMANDLKELQARYPNVPIVIGEWGTVTGGDTVTQVNTTMSAGEIPGVVGFNYWHMGVGGNEALINEDFSKNPQYSTVQSFFLPF